MADLIELQKKFLRLRADKDALEQKKTELNQEINALQDVLAEQMSAIGQTHTIVDGHRLTVRTTPRIAKLGCIQMDAFCEVLSKTDLAFLVKPSVHAGSLQSALKEILEETGALPKPLEELVKRWDQTVVAVSRA